MLNFGFPELVFAFELFGLAIELDVFDLHRLLRLGVWLLANFRRPKR